jgi:hypothetical protein|tara:strand:- start:376 stop:504 length:129 start_codon:yes stop_codon:yes gene_type:complete
MKTSIFNMNFTLPPMLEITQMKKDMPMSTFGWGNVPGMPTCH